mgnify:CR=1 FL=1
MKLDPVSIEEAARYMGVRGVPDEAVCGLLIRADEMVRNSLSPKYVYRETSVDITESGVKLGCMNVTLTGKDIASHLSGCTKAVLLAATLSSEADKLIRQYSVRDMAFSLALDCVCSAAVEQVCEKAEEEIFSAPGLEWIPPLGQIAARGLDTPLEEMAEAELRELCEEVEWATNLDEEAPSSDR